MRNSKLKLIVGLGNPGPKYRFTRHNAGAQFLEQLCQDHGVEMRSEAKFFGELGRLSINGEDVRLLCPTTYMNHSGRAVAAVCQYFDIAPENLLVAYDEIDFEIGITRFKQGGGHGGHNGMRDIVKALSSKDFHRLRIGVGHPGDKSLVSDYVLGDPSKTQAESIQDNIDKAIKALPCAVAGQWEQAMLELHTR